MQVELSKDEYDDLLKMRKEKKQNQLSGTIQGRIPTSNAYNKGHVRNWLQTLDPDLLEKILEMYNVPNNVQIAQVEPADWDVDDGPTPMSTNPFAQPATTNEW